MRITQLLHASVIVSDVSRALSFYVDLLGLVVDDTRPNMDFEGAWLNIGEQQLHLLQVPNPDPIDNRPEHGGRDRHTAFAVREFDELRARLQHARWPFTLSRSGRRALFIRDPDGNTLELVEEMD